MKVAEAGFPVVAIMGSSLSAVQEDVLSQRFKHVVFMFDGDDAGRNAMTECLSRLGRRVWMKTVPLEDNQQPDALSASEITARLAPLLQ